VGAVPKIGAFVIAAAMLASAPPRLRAQPAEFDLRAASELPQLRTLLVSWHGRLAAEYHGRGVRPDAPANVKSVSKSIIAALVGIAIERGLIKGIAEPIVTYFPELRRDADTRKPAITIEDLVTMRAGLESTSGRNYGAWVRSGNWVRHALRQPMVSEPGGAMEYSTGSSHLLSAILTKASGTSTWQFAQEALAKPLGFDLPRWSTDPQGIYFGGNDMLMTPRQMLLIGEMYLHKGRAGDRQIMPQAWVEASCEGRARSPRTNERYGYG